LGLFGASHFLTWGGSLALLGWGLATRQWEWAAGALGGLGLKWAVQGLVLAGCKRRLADQTPLGLLPLLDFLYAAYYLVVGLAAFQSKQLRWK
jgi:hypothetical protein